jgi:hypothetical protein
MRKFAYGLICRACLTVLFMVAVFVLGWVPKAATAEPSRWESFLGHRALSR